MLKCEDCKTSDIFCTCETKVCQTHLSGHIGLNHNLRSISKTESHFLFHLNQKSIQKAKERLEHLELCNSKNKLRPFEIKNLEKNYINLATKDDLNENMIPVIIDKNIWVIDFNKKIYKVVERQVIDRYGFTMNVYKSRLLIIGGTDGLKKFEIIEDLFDSDLTLKLENPRCFHSSVMHNDSLYVIGGLLKFKNCFSIEVISLVDYQNTSYSDIECKMISPISFVINTKIVTYFTEGFSSAGKNLKKFEFDVNFNARNVKNVKERDRILFLLKKFNSFWSPSNLNISEDLKKVNSAKCALVYLIEEEKILKIDFTKHYIQYINLKDEDEFRILLV